MSLLFSWHRKLLFTTTSKMLSLVRSGAGAGADIWDPVGEFDLVMIGN